jgi:hypothetical protein
MERKYPCQAIVRRSESDLEPWYQKNIEGKKVALDGVEVTVLQAAKRWCCCGHIMAYPVELPDRFGEATGKCGHWLVLPENLVFAVSDKELELEAKLNEAHTELLKAREQIANKSAKAPRKKASRKKVVTPTSQHSHNTQQGEKS